MRTLIISSFIIGVFASGVASAQQAGAPALDEQQTLGRRLLNQHCAICHLKPQLGAGTYGPALSKETLGGQEAVLREVIGNGLPRMPGFKHEFRAEQIGAIIAYLKTVPAPAAPAKP